MTVPQQLRATPLQQWRAWFAQRGWAPLPFQRDVWKRYLDGESGLLHTPTGSGKTLAAFGGPLLEALAARGRKPAARSARPAASARRQQQRTLQVLWITPLRALAADTARALREPVDALGLDWQVGLRTGDASARDKRLARSGKLDVLVTTPESLALLLSYPDTAPQLSALRCVIVDEWHELLGNKRGVLLQLCLARLRGWTPTLRIWGLSATLGNLAQARDVLLPHLPHAALVSGVRPRAMTLETLLPDSGERFPWAGHLGLAQLARVLQKILQHGTSLVFTNTRAQAELWHQALSAVWPDDLATLALHHGSLDPSLRTAAEQGLRDGSLRCVVATSSLDLGVDFPAVDQVLQVGSPKGIARLLQRAGRARHRPGESGHVVCVPSHALELVEYAAARRAIAHGHIEARPPPRLSLDVLAQHCVTLALGGGFDADALFAQVRGTDAFAALDPATWTAVLDFIVQGGSALAHYPDFHKVVRDDDGIYRVTDRRVALRHRLSIGTITSDGSVRVQFLRGGRLGAVEEQFVGRLRRGDRFQFAGRLLELVRLEDMTAYVRVAKGGSGVVPKWMGGRMPLSSALGREVEALFADPGEAPEMQALAPLVQLQATLSALPGPNHLLVESIKARDGRHVFVYPFAGRQVNEGLAALLAARWGRRQRNTFSFAANDYGFVLSPAQDVEIDAGLLQALLSPVGLFDDLRDSLNLGELARRQFREIARVAGLLSPSLPGRAPRSLRQLQASSGLLYDVLQRFDPDHLLLAQAEREVFEGQLELARLAHALEDCARRELRLCTPRSLTPLSFPLWAERVRGQLSTEDWKARVLRAAEQLERKHGR
ncbi:ligase-associated DNA damage response DEXH box helicase [Xanthomonas floridensis]|uniref:DNA ligase-associated DEXH box helicase n=1 Tax=Xanthomonas floridensis TaxID=1843580 RepID=A0A1A9MCT2_9XANT|nr:ligase-associated DNA damage response DEXH box helicase [Xanthomonas floridensis]MEA5125312.1 ligase-associated DNA damage response DEXH box helicase [Xanthomonas floridensis]MEA5133002.1 ligase-associated DNA damage response DEXH box helicase [Xanthomonas floridensis]OAG67400.1 DNA ligase-associated DEXH box helicase [Xanthomonas floridensis]